MFRKNYFSFLLLVVLFTTGGIAVFAQSAPVSGTVMLKKADGTTEPVAGAKVEVYRTDQKGKFPSDKTDKKGRFAFAGLPLGASFAFAISGQGIKPEITPNIKAGMEKLVVTVVEGDGKQWTEDEVRQALANPTQAKNDSPAPAKKESTEPAQPAQPAEMTAEQKKQQEEYLKKKADVESGNKKIENANATIQKSLQEGNKAYDAKDYDTAVAKFEEGYQASPDFVGSAPVLLNNKGAALRSRIVVNYNSNVKSTDAAAKTAAMTKVKQDLSDALDAYDKSYTILTTAPAADVSDPKAQESSKLEALRGAKETLKLMAATEKVDLTKVDIAKKLMSEYLKVETDQAKKVEGQRILGDIYRVAGDMDNAIAEYKKVLIIEPTDPDALSGLGLSLVNGAYNEDGTVDKAKMQEAANYLQKFTEVAPSNHKYMDDAQSLLADLKKQQNVSPQKNAKKKP